MKIKGKNKEKYLKKCPLPTCKNMTYNKYCKEHSQSKKRTKHIITPKEIRDNTLFVTITERKKAGVLIKESVV